MINEDSLMEDSAQQDVIAKTCGDNDRIMPGKPCANCTCGKKELYETAEGQK